MQLCGFDERRALERATLDDRHARSGRTEWGVLWSGTEPLGLRGPTWLESGRPEVRSVSTGFGRTVSPYDNFHEREKTVVYHNYPRMAEERAFVGSPCWLRPRIEPPSENGSADGLMLNHTSTKF
ncbi:hypothetical protein V1477_017691 [Vespula maculifrons]|uniref:Uncharacterized protein n=2 Tax=Vespula TaxID=7451 RepID=A0A834N8M7_VESVU|nr:hypothetical protein HZH66_005446 [Vespula vulgaris]